MTTPARRPDQASASSSSSASNADKRRAVASQMARDLIETCANLTAVMQEENSAIQKRDFKTIADLQEKKARLSVRYEDGVQTIKQDVVILAALDGHERERLLQAQQAFRVASAENLKVIDQARSVGHKIMDIIRKAVEEQSGEKANYTARAGMGAYSRTAAVSTNEVL